MNATEQDWAERIGAAKRLLEHRLDEDVPLEDVAAAAHASMFHFHRMFRGMTGETVRDYVRRLRLERAAHHLTHTDQDILRIALDAGYDSHEAFTRAFKKRFDTPPSIFREERREIKAAHHPNTEQSTMEVSIKRQEPVRIACVRHVGPYSDVGQAWGALMKWGWTKMMFGKPETFGLCFDDPEVTASDKVRYEACMVVDGKAKAKGDVAVRDLPGGEFAVALHEGPYERIGETYAALFAQVSRGPINGASWRLGDPPSREKYLNDPRKTKPEDLRTEIWMPVSRG